MELTEKEYLEHYGTPRRSGRYPWGSGGDDSGTPRNSSFLDDVKELRKQGLSDAQIAKGMNISTTEFRARNSIARSEHKQGQISMAQRLKDKGLSNTAIGEQMSLNESSVRALLAPGAKVKADALMNTANQLKDYVDKKEWVDVGSGTEAHMNISKERLGAAVAILNEQGYPLHRLKESQLGTGLETDMKVLGLPGTTGRQAFENRGKIFTPAVFSDDGGTTYGRVDHPPISINPSRVGVRYKEDGGDTADGVIYVRPGVDDISMGNSRYAQVRILVGKDHYLKGMAMYKDDLPDGVDLQFNTNKSSTGNKLDAMKPIGEDKDYPFGAIVRQIVTDKGTPQERNTSAMNIVNEEGNWGKWSKNISSQMLSKQSEQLAKQQLDVTYERRKKEFDEINALTNPTVKKKLLQAFADDTDSAAVHLKAASFKRSSWHAILPIDSISKNEIYAPNFRNGEEVVLIRYPHGGTFEIPRLKVNNKQKEAEKLLGRAQDAVGIHFEVAKRLSGADFDGDTVLVIPNGSKRIKTTPALEGLKDFDPQVYKVDKDDYTTITPSRKQQEMGKVSNLITDMTLNGAGPEELARAIRHSMVVIDSEKHNLNYKQSAIDNGISSLKQRYQGGATRGAATLISRKKSFVDVPELKGRPQGQGGPVDRETGRKVFVETGRTRTTKDGKVIPRKTRINKLATADDAHSLSSGTKIEELYADHSNKLKDLANKARIEHLHTPLLKTIPSSKLVYKEQVDSLNASLALVIRNRPLERQAQIIGNAAIRAKRQANPNLEPEQIKKLKFKELEKARQRTGAKGRHIKITPKEWEAIQAGAISDNKLSQILDKADIDTVRKFATPKRVPKMSSAYTARAKSMLASGYTRAEVADALGVSLTTLDTATGPTKEE